MVCWVSRQLLLDMSSNRLRQKQRLSNQHKLDCKENLTPGHSNPWKTFLSQIAKINIFRKKRRKYIHHPRLTHHLHLCASNVVCVFNTMLACFHVDTTSISPYHITYGGHRVCPWVIGSATGVNEKYPGYTTIAIPFCLYNCGI